MLKKEKTQQRGNKQQHNIGNGQYENANRKPTISGLHSEAIERSTDDKNLAPFLNNHFETFQYGNSSLISINTDHPDWAPGECLNLHKYEGRFRIKIFKLTQQVNNKTSWDELRSTSG